MHAFVPPLMGRDEIAAYYDLYVPDRTDRSDIRFAPLAGRLENLPPALVVTAGQDLFADEGARYADALAQAGVPGVPHGEPRALPAFLTPFSATQASARNRAASRDFHPAPGAGSGREPRGERECQYVWHSGGSV